MGGSLIKTKIQNASSSGGKSSSWTTNVVKPSERQEVNVTLGDMEVALTHSVLNVVHTWHTMSLSIGKVGPNERVQRKGHHPGELVWLKHNMSDVHKSMILM